MKRTIPSYFLTVVGVGLLAVSLYFIKTIEDPQGMLRALLYICFGLGCAIFGHGMAELIGRLMHYSWYLLICLSLDTVLITV